MGKIEISEDLRNKLNKVLTYKSADMGDVPFNTVSNVGPAPSWKPTLQQSAPPPPPPPPPPPSSPPHQPHLQPHSMYPQYYYIKPDKNKKKKEKLNYLKITKVVFLSSVVAGIGITLGLKIANILFF